ncbi:MAG: nodulation protein NfeD [Candidatus Methanofastidiosia archaeon]|jgi:membrane-bound serine protease (ClpP class)
MKKIYLSLFIVMLLLSTQTKAEEKTVYLIKITAEINPSSERIFADAIAEAAANNADALIIQLDTPGGAGDSMMRIIQLIDQSSVPVIIFVAPQGAIAASAGTFISMGAHLVAMAPGTSIGACSPIIGYDPTSGQVQEAPDKYKKFYAGVMRSLAESHNRDPELAEKFVLENLTLTADEALQKDMADLVAVTVTEVLEKSEGMKTRGPVMGEMRELHLTGAEIVELEIGLPEKILSIVTNPTIAYLLLMVGIYGLIFGFLSPGWHVPETVGAICLILAIIAFGYVDLNAGGIILIIAAFIFFIVEALTPTFGLFTSAGAVCLFFGSLILFRVNLGEAPQLDRLVTREWYIQFRYVIIAVTIVSATFFAFALYKAIRLRMTRAQTGGEEILGMVGVADEDLEMEGQIKIRGERWKAKAIEIIKKGEKVKVIDRKGLLLIVEKTDE